MVTIKSNRFCVLQTVINKTDENVDLLKDKDNGSLSIAPIKDEKDTTVFCIIVRPDLISVRINQVFLL